MPSSEFRPAEELKPDDTCAFLFAGTGSAGAPDLPALARTGPGAARAVADVLDAVQEGLPPAGWPSLRTILLDDPAAYRPAARAPGAGAAGAADGTTMPRSTPTSAPSRTPSAAKSA